MGQFDIFWLMRHVPDLRQYKYCVETGTLFGNSTEVMRRVFERVFTIEIMEDLHRKALERFKNYPSVKCIHGDSGSEINNLLASGELDQPTVFFLDAHWSGDNTTNWETSNWKGYNVNTGYRKGDSNGLPSADQQVPLMEEMNAILDTYPNKCVIYIDDMDKLDENMRGLKDVGFSGEDWSTTDLSGWFERAKSRIVHQHRDNNQMIIVLGSKL